MHNLLRWTASWSCFRLGQAASWVLESGPDTFYWSMIWYRVYNRFMLWSSDIQGSTEYGPWKDG